MLRSRRSARCYGESAPANFLHALALLCAFEFFVLRGACWSGCEMINSKTHCLSYQWRHLAPTAPDTLPCFPVKDEVKFRLPTSFPSPPALFLSSYLLLPVLLPDPTSLPCS
eukprot:269202-Hanusia_phi.AAC.2